MNKIIPLKRAAQIIAGQSPPSQVVSDLDGSQLPFLQGNAEFGSLHPEARSQCDVAPKKAERGDILLSVRAPVGALNKADRSYGIGRGLCAIRPAANLDEDFAWWTATGITPQLAAVATGSTYDAVTADDVGALRIPFPSFVTQRAIAYYLDRETARIDALIAAKRRMVELLDERLQGVVSEVVHARYVVDSKHRLPDGWRPMQLKRCLTSAAYGIGEAPDADGEFAVLGMSNISRGEVVGLPGGFVSAVDDDLLLTPGDLLFNRTNSRELVGKVGLVTSLDQPTTFASYLVRLKVNALADAEYLNYLLNSREVLGLARSMALPSIGQANLNPSRYSAIVLPMPPVEEQRRLISRLNELALRAIGMRRTLKSQVVLLQERRQALITAAVTGQLDIPEAA